MKAAPTTSPAFTAAALLATVFLGLPLAESQAATSVDPPLAAKQAETLWRWVGYRTNPGSDCPTASGWSSAPLFESAGGLAAPGLAPYCLYERSPGVPAGQDAIRALQNLVGAGLRRIQVDALAVAPYGTELQDLFAGPAREHFLNHAGRPLPLPITGSLPVRLAFIDTAATSETASESPQGASPHGFSLISMARELLCEGPDCLATITSQLALAYRWPAPGCAAFHRAINNPNCRNEVDGGRVGLISELGQAIFRATDRWLEVAPPGQPLVINLSVGWLPIFGGGESFEKMPLNVQSVHRALEYASCRGALVFAAVGDEKNGSTESSGPLYPAGWERVVAPRPGNCFELLGSPPPISFPPAAQDLRSLVYAAGAVQDNSQPLFNSREESEPRLVAFGDHAVAQVSPVAGFTPGLTGSSVAAAVLSSAAAAVWYYQPNRPSWEVIERLYDSGSSLGRSASICRGGTPADPCPIPTPEVRQVSVCAAADAACATGGPSCPPPGALACPPRTPLDITGIDLASFEQSAEITSLESLDQTLMDPVCVDEVVHYSGVAPTNPCPHQQYHSVWAETWTAGGQPGSHPCPACTATYAGPGKVYIEIDDAFVGVLSGTVLKCASNVYVLPLSGPIGNGYKGVVTDLPCQALSPVELSFTVNGNQSVTSPVLNLD